ncbi:conserved hypothetical protein [Shewanella denitrificans OS217]|uniref:DUF3083 family protein n=1 Tax=Shewanella denitrificans (strain OS217 / ATCC BAA-1090 / DSM 15013) TaxID=318161 RepID=Q12LM7_SHEDO|nr:DUF3083 family protein [Shewanella denitrificans]ABE55649.1 conserved hypothetical protein [Shewanella denitrificans OS217]
MSVSRQKKVYIPTTARKNQYITVGFPLTEAILAAFPDAPSCYEALSQIVFKLADEHELINVHVIANDKLPVVRYHSESYCFPTSEQLRIFYNPAYHEARQLHTTPDFTARKFRVVFLATGGDIRVNSAAFHAKVQHFVEQLKPLLPVQNVPIKVRDHQHLSYDFFAKAKGNKETYGYKLRAIDSRYHARECNLPDNHSALCYVTISMPVNRQILSQFKAAQDADYGNLYQSISQAFIDAAQSKQLSRVAMVANGLTPLVRNSKYEKLQTTAESQMIGFDPNAEAPAPITHWDSSKLVDSIKFAIVASKSDVTDEGYGRFMNQVEEALQSFTSSLNLDRERVDMILRFHQHISYSK